MVQRTETQGMQQLGPAQSRSAQVINRAVQTPFVDTNRTKRVSGILDALSGLTSATSEAAFKQSQIAIEQKKIDGMAKAVSGGKLGEDATKAEQMGYDVVESQSKLGKINEELSQYLQSNPEVSDEQFTEVKNQKYGDLLSQYQDRSPEVFKAISVKAQESQITLQGIRTKVGEQFRKQKGLETLNYNIGSNLDAIKTPEQGAQYLHSIMGQGQALGLSEFETKDQILNQMKLSAANGDARLLKAVQSTDWGRYTQESKQGQALYKSYVKQAQSEYEAAIQKQNVVYYAQGLATMENLAKAGAPQEQILAQAEQLRSRGYKFSPSSLASYLTMGTNVSKSQQQLNSNVKLWQEGINSGYNLATNPNIPADDKQRVLSFGEDAIIQQAQNVPEDQRQAWLTEKLVQFSSQQGLPIKSISTAIGSIANLDPSQPITPAVQNWARMIVSTDDQTLRMNSGSDKDYAFAIGMRDVLVANQGQPLEKIMPTAIARAQGMRDNKIPLSAEQTKAVVKGATKSVKTLEDPTQTTWYLAAKDLPNQSRDFISNQVASEAKRLAPLLGSTERANEVAFKEWKNKNIVLTGGVVGNAGVQQIANYNPELVKPGDSADMVQKRAVSALDSQINDIIKAHAKEDGIDYKRDQVNINFSNDGSTYQVLVGGISTGEVYSTRNLNQQYNEDYFKNWSKEQDKQQEESQRSHDIYNPERLKMSDYKY
ncbi:internal virion protein [Pantoea phage Nufs112]|nr:internal virion protein [Pantoea phage Nufs112]